MNAYLLPLSALLLAGGAAGDLYGRRLLLIGGVAVFAAASGAGRGAVRVRAGGAGARDRRGGVRVIA